MSVALQELYIRPKSGEIVSSLDLYELISERIDVLKIPERKEALWMKARALRAKIDEILFKYGGPDTEWRDVMQLPPTMKPDIPLWSKDRAKQNGKTVVNIGDAILGGNEITLMAGPCAIEKDTKQNKLSLAYRHTINAAIAAFHAGARVLRGGAFKPRTGPFSFQGLESEGLIVQAEIANELGMSMVTETTSPKNVELVACALLQVKKGGALQVGARNGQNYDQLARVGLVAGETGLPVLLKRGSGMTTKEWLQAAEYILAYAHLIDPEWRKLSLCERGTGPNQELDLDGVSQVSTMTDLIIAGDPTHSSKVGDEVRGRTLAALREGVIDVLIIEVHPQPDEAMCDGIRAVTPDQLLEIAQDLEVVAPKLGKTYKIPNLNGHLMS